MSTVEPTAGQSATAPAPVGRRAALRHPIARYPVRDAIDDLVWGREQTINSVLRSLPVGSARAGLIGSAADFSPDDIAGLAHWYDATALTGFNDGDSVGTWTDVEGTDDLTQGTGSKQPTYQTGVIGGKPVVRFDGTDDRLDVDWSDVSEAYMFFVVFIARSTVTGSIIDGISLNEHRFLIDGDNNWRIVQGTGLVGTAADTNAHIATLTFRTSGNNDELRLDAVQEISGDAGASNSGGLAVGELANGNTPKDVDVGELVFYNTELSTSDRDEVEAYLSDKWGITI